MDVVKNLESMLASGQDNALLRYSLGNAYLKQGAVDKAIEHLGMAVQHDDSYSAAWKVYGKALAEAQRIDDAVHAYEKGIHVAEQSGDIQAAKEMRVFLKRLRKNR
jgi:Tfp pilus assembly protein PilF